MMEKKNILDPYMRAVHRIGRLGSLAVILAFIAAGVAICIHNDCFPDVTLILTVAIPLFIAMSLSSVGEFLGFLPTLGSGATYISYITGNISNMKLPAILGAMEALDVDKDSEEYQVLSVISSVVASLLVMALLTIVVLFSSQLTPFLKWEPIQPAFNNVMPALYPILLIGLLRKKPLVCLLTAVILIPVILYLNPISRNVGGVFFGMLFAVVFSLAEFKYKSRKK